MLLILIHVVSGLQHPHLRWRGAPLRSVPADDVEISEQALLEVAETRALHSGIYHATFDGGAENRVFLAASGKATAVRDLYGEGGGAGRGGAREGAWRITAVNASAVEATITLGRYSLSGITLGRDYAAGVITGAVLEGAVEGDYVGKFELRLASRAFNESDIGDRLAAAEAALAKRPAPPPRFSRASFLANRRSWMLDAVLEGERAVFLLDLKENGDFVDTAADGSPRIGGSWGVYDDGARERATDGKGSDVWLWIRRSKSRRMNLHADLRLHGSASFEGSSLESELASRGADRAPDRASGVVLFGDIPDMEYSALIGTFELTPAATLPEALRGRLPVGGLET